MRILLVSCLMLLNLSSFSQDGYQPVRIVRNDTAFKVDIFIGDNYFTSYLYKAAIEKPILYPITAANGTVITRGFPLHPRPGERVDHPHQLGMWFTFGDVNGLDFWNNSYAIPENEKKKYGRIVHTNISESSTNVNSGKLKVEMVWVDYLGNVILNEETTYIFSGTENFRFIKKTCKLTAGDKNVIFGDNKEGLMGIRVDRAFETAAKEPLIFTDASGKPTKVAVMDNAGVNGLYKSSNGFKGDSVWGTRNKWVALTANLKNSVISLAFFDHPQNHGYPAYAHARGYGLFALNNFGQHAFKANEPVSLFELKAKEETTFRYLFAVKSGGEMTNAEANDLSGRFEAEIPSE